MNEEKKSCVFQRLGGNAWIKIIAGTAEEAIKTKDQMLKAPDEWKLEKVEAMGKSPFDKLMGR